jgi:hypothetical protein
VKGITNEEELSQEISGSCQRSSRKRLALAFLLSVSFNVHQAMPKKGAALPKKKQKKTDDSDVVLFTKSGSYTRQQLEQMELDKFLQVSSRQENCRFFVPDNCKDTEYAFDGISETVC